MFPTSGLELGLIRKKMNFLKVSSVSSPTKRTNNITNISSLLTLVPGTELALYINKRI